jgi:UDP-glucose 4-epimerase
MLFGLAQAREPLNIFNLAPRDFTTAQRIAELCIAHSPYPSAGIRFTGGERGWPGDVPISRLDPSKLETLGFRVSRSSEQAVAAAVSALSREVFGAG